MKLRIVSCLLASAFLFAAVLQAQSNLPTIKPLSNPSNPFENSLVQPSAPFQFILSPQGRRILRMGAHPLSKTLLRWMGEDTTGVPDFLPKTWRNMKSGSSILPPGDPALGAGCLSTTGQLFNLEPAAGDPNTGLNFPLPQNEESVDFLPNELGATATGPDLVLEGSNDFRGLFGGLGSSLSGYYVHSAGTTSNCSLPTFEGGMPAVSAGGEDIFAFGDPVVSADPLRHQFFYASIGIGPAIKGINLYKTTTANLINTAVCPAGTHTDLDAAACWPTSIGIEPFFSPNPNSAFDDKPHMRVDEALPCAPAGCTGAQHVGGGDVYVAYTLFNAFGKHAQIRLVACTNSLSDCSNPETISGDDFNTQFPHISVRPDGTLSITYVDVSQAQSGHFEFSIKYVSCSPNGEAPSGAPIQPTCMGGFPGVPGSPQLVLADANAIPQTDFPLSGEGFRIATYPKNDYQVETNQHIWQYIVWDRCKVPLLFSATCPDSDVIAVAADTGVAGSPILAPAWSRAFAVANASGKHEFMPWIRTDASRNIINIMYYNNVSDAFNFNHRPVVSLRQILPCPGTAHCIPGGPFTVTTTPDEPQGDNVYFQFDPGFGDYQGVAARGTATGASRAYVGYTANYRLGLTEGLSVVDEDNYISQATY